MSSACTERPGAFLSFQWCSWEREAGAALELELDAQLLKFVSHQEEPTWLRLIGSSSFCRAANPRLQDVVSHPKRASDLSPIKGSHRYREMLEVVLTYSKMHVSVFFSFSPVKAVL